MRRLLLVLLFLIPLSGESACPVLYPTGEPLSSVVPTTALTACQAIVPAQRWFHNVLERYPLLFRQTRLPLQRALAELSPNLSEVVLRIREAFFARSQVL